MYPVILALHYFLFALLLSPLLTALWLGWSFHRHPNPPRWAIQLSVGFGVCMILFLIMWRLKLNESFWLLIDFSPNEVRLVTGGISLCLINGIWLMLRRMTSLRPLPSLACSCAPVLIGLLWLNLRFIVVIHNRSGQLVDLDPTIGRRAVMHANSPGFSGSFHEVKGIRLQKGVYYFGFNRWFRFGDRWALGSGFGGNFDAGWNEWPIRGIASENRHRNHDGSN